MRKLDPKVLSLLKALSQGKKESPIKYKLAYVIFPWHNNPESNTRQVGEICRDIMAKHPIITISSHFAFDLLYGATNNRDPLQDVWSRLPSEDKWQCLQVGIADLTLVAKCDLIIVAHPLQYDVSPGMCWEYCLAKLLGKPILYWKDGKLKEKYPWVE